MDEITKKWEERCSAVLVGKTISHVRYLNNDEKESMAWYRRSLVIFFNDGSYLFASADSEGNDGGALFTSMKNLEVIPAL